MQTAFATTPVRTPRAPQPSSRWGLRLGVARGCVRARVYAIRYFA